jgi:hypothetical protein
LKTLYIYPMNFDNLNELPEWDDDDFKDEDCESEDWKLNPTSQLCRAMYEQWNTVLLVLKAAFDSMKEPGEDSLFNKEFLEDQKEMILGDAYEIAAKIRSSEVGLYVIRMENAAIIRKNAQFIKASANNFEEDDLMEPEHRHIIRQEIDIFRDLFKQWVASFERDEFGDEWGLFN